MFRNVLQLSPTFARSIEVHLRLAIMHKKRGDYHRSLDHFRKSLCIPGPSSFNKLESKLERRKKFGRGKKKNTTRMGFEPTRAEHNGLAVHRLNHSATSSNWLWVKYYNPYNACGTAALTFLFISFTVQFHIGHVCFLQGNFMAAKESFERILSSKAVPNHTKAMALKQLG